MYAHVLLCDFSKAFDLVDHQLVLQKLSDLDIPPFLVKWAASFLLKRMQQVKIGSHVSTPVLLNARCPQGTLFGPLAFVPHINDLHFPDLAFGIKYVDDSLAAHSSKSPGDETIQVCADYMNDWSIENDIKNNAKITNDMIFCFARPEPNFILIYINGTEIEHMKEKKILGVILSDNLKWNAHIGEIVRKANKRLFFLRFLKNACPNREYLVVTYTSL